MAGKTPNIVPKGMTGMSLPQGYFLGRVSAGVGAVELVSAAQAKANGLTPSSLPPNGPAGGDLGGTYPNPSVIALRGRLLNSTAPTDGQVLTYVAASTDIEWKTPSSGVLTGAGAPTSLQPAGTLYSQTDADAVWSSQPTPAANASIVQTTIGGSGNGITAPQGLILGTAPTVGNLILCYLAMTNDRAINTGNWTVAKSDTGSADNIFGALLYRYVQAGDTTALPQMSGGATRWQATVYEIGNVTGVFATDVPQTTAIYNQTSNYNTPAGTTSGVNQLAIIGTFDWNTTTNMTNPSGWTSDRLGNGGVALTFAYLATHQLFPTIGTSFSAPIVLATASGSFAFTAVLAQKAAIAHWAFVGPSSSSGTSGQSFRGEDGYDGADGFSIVGPAGISVVGLQGPPGQDGADAEEQTIIFQTSQPLPTRQVLTSGTAATYTTPAGVRQLRIRMIAGGGGGGGSNGSASSGAGNGGTGGDTIFNGIHVSGGIGGFFNSLGGSGELPGTGTASIRIPGGDGGPGNSTTATILNVTGGFGGDSMLGFGTTQGGMSPTNSGVGGAGATAGTTGVASNSAGGGQGGEGAELIINFPAGTYIFTVGSAGTGGVAGSGPGSGTGLDGGSGLIIVDELY